MKSSARWILLPYLLWQVVSWHAACAASPSATFQLIPGSRATWAVSADGSTVIGITGLGASYNTYRWTATAGRQLLGTDLTLNDLSANGDIVVGLDGIKGLRLSTSQGKLSAPGHVIEVRGSSADGRVLVGSNSYPAGRGAFRWTEANGEVPIGDLPGGSFFGIAEAVSGDGYKIVGQSSSDFGEEPYLWTEFQGMRSLGSISGSPFRGWAFDISDDGQVVVGVRNLDSGGEEAFRWTETGGRLDLGDIPGGSVDSVATGVSANGDVVVGSGQDDSGQVAFIWDKQHGMRRLQDMLSQDYGLNVGSQLYEARDVSADGRTIVGTAVVGGQFEGFVVTLPAVPEPSCLVVSGAALAVLTGCRIPKRNS